MLSSCVEHHETAVEPQPLPFAFDESLVLCDSLLQHYADSAMICLTSFRPTEGSGEISHTFNANYQSLLISEALYKTDNPQYYRSDLQDAMRRFDSLYAVYPANDDLVMLAARSHYMNGVGFYEDDSVVDACREYLKTLEIMEDHFGVETSQGTALQGYKAKFMGLTYNRLVELFSDQFMTEPAIYCGKKSLHYCKIKTTSKYGIANVLSEIGTNYNILGCVDSAYLYFKNAFVALPDTNNLIYRDLVSKMALLSYESGHGLQASVNQLFQIAKQADSEGEIVTRYFTIGSLYYLEKMYDSAIVYLNRVFEYDDNNIRKLQSADFLMKIYQMSNDTLMARRFSEFLAPNAVLKYENSFKVSTLNDIFQNYLLQKSDKSQKRIKNRTIIVILILFILFVTSVAFLFMHFFRKSNKKHRRVVNTERKARYREKSKMLDIIKQQEIKVNALEHELEQKRHETDLHLEALLNEPVCKRIKYEVGSINLSSRVNYSDYPNLKLNDTTIADLDEAITKHFPNFKQRMFSRNPHLKQNDLLLCYLYLIGLKDQQISVLMHYHYSTIFRKAKYLEKSLNINVTLSEYVQKMAVL